MTDTTEIEAVELAHVMSTRSGRNVVRRILETTGLDVSTWNQDSHLHAMNAGRRTIGIQLRDTLIAQAPGEYLTMLKEGIGNE